ncbi:MAG: hydroxyacylglutathione hydrolase [Gemmobacter sp.]
MPNGLEIVTIPCLRDNYAYIARSADSIAVIDAPEAAPIAQALDARGWQPDTLLLTHHHHDHVGGVADLRARYGCAVVGPEAEADRLPPLDRAVGHQDSWGAGPGRVEVIAVPGHTLGHVAYHFPEGGAVFTADSLMALGCGRVFEGTMAQMWHSLSRLGALPPETLVCSGHEYTLSNGRFAVTVDRDNPALRARIARIEADRAADRPTVPSRLSEELATNPFLRVADPAIRAHLGLKDASDEEVFAEIRHRKDRF